MNSKRRGSLTKEELAYYGAECCLAIFRHRPHEIVRVYVERRRLTDFAPLLKWCAAERRAYHVVEADDLARFTKSEHHEGISVVARRLPRRTLPELIPTLPDGALRIILLGSLSNPHNLGAILRSAAHFGARGIVGVEGMVPSLSAAACRIAEGGAELVPLYSAPDAPAALAALSSAGIATLATSSHASVSVFDDSLPGRAAFVLGAESTGVAPEIASQCDRVIVIPGTGSIESLNVASAASVLLAEHWRRYG